MGQNLPQILQTVFWPGMCLWICVGQSHRSRADLVFVRDRMLTCILDRHKYLLSELCGRALDQADGINVMSLMCNSYLGCEKAYSRFLVLTEVLLSFHPKKSTSVCYFRGERSSES